MLAGTRPTLRSEPNRARTRVISAGLNSLDRAAAGCERNLTSGSCARRQSLPTARDGTADSSPSSQSESHPVSLLVSSPGFGFATRLAIPGRERRRKRSGVGARRQLRSTAHL